MRIVGITGGIGSGKSIICKIFRQFGIPVYDSDHAAHQIYENYPHIATKVAEEISPEVLDKSGRINRKMLAEIVFANPSKLNKLNAIVHPVVKLDFEKWIAGFKGVPYVLKEAAILYESGADSLCDKVISVSAPAELRIARVRARDNKSRDEIEKIISKQMKDEDREERSDYVITNDEKQLVIPQVLKIHTALIK